MNIASTASVAGVASLATDQWPSVVDLDPLGEDQLSDKTLVVTERELLRLLMIAAATAERMQEEGGLVDPMSWLLSPRRLFGGLSALEACSEREHFIRATILHGLRLGLDAEASDVDHLRDEAAEFVPSECDTPTSPEVVLAGLSLV